MSTPKISVVLASYNHAAFVRQSIESALTQSGPEVDVVITDDGSQDGTADVIRAIGDPRIHFNAFPTNQGACVAINDAIRRARGEFVAILNSDDYFLPGKLERQAAFLDAHPQIGAVFALPNFVDERGHPFRNPGNVFVGLFTAENRSRTAWLKHLFYFGNCLCHPTILIRRTCYDRIGLLDPLLMQVPDWDLWIRLCSVYDIHVLPEPLTAYRILDRERNTSAPSKPSSARAAWETAAVLEHFKALSDADLAAILADEPDAGYPLRVRLALAAIRLARPGYSAFGLAVLRDIIRQNPDSFSYREYFQLVGAADPFGSALWSREHQWVARSRAVSGLRRMVRWMKSLNLKM